MFFCEPGLVSHSCAGWGVSISGSKERICHAAGLEVMQLLEFKRWLTKLGPSVDVDMVGCGCRLVRSDMCCETNLSTTSSSLSDLIAPPLTTHPWQVNITNNQQPTSPGAGWDLICSMCDVWGRILFLSLPVCMSDNSCSLLQSKCCGWLNQLSVNRFCWEIMSSGGWVSRFLNLPHIIRNITQTVLLRMSKELSFSARFTNVPMFRSDIFGEYYIFPLGLHIDQ